MLRARDGAVDLTELRAAQKAAEFLRTTHGSMPLLLGVRVVVASDVGLELEVTLVRVDSLWMKWRTERKADFTFASRW